MSAEKKKKEMNVISQKWNVIFLAIFILVAAITVLPVLLIIIISFSSSDSLAEVGYSFFPASWSLNGYIYLFKMGNQFFSSYLVTIAYATIGTILGLIIMTMYAYVICQKSFWLARAFMWFLFVTMLFSGGLVPSYILNVRYYHLKDSFWVLILPSLVNAYWVIVLRTFIKTSIPEALIDSARIDGAGHFRIYVQIVCPLLKAGVGTIGLFSFVAKWNDWFRGMLYIENPRLVPLQTLLVKLQNTVDYLKENSDMLGTVEGNEYLKNMPGVSLRMACTVVAFIPIVFAYPFFQRYFVGGLTVGSIKE